MLSGIYSFAIANEDDKKEKLAVAELSEPTAKKSEDSPKDDTSTPGVTVKQDTTEANSVSKFNFVFYFIYKMKYTEDAEGREYVDYGF